MLAAPFAKNSRVNLRAVDQPPRSQLFNFTAVAAYPACQVAVRHLSNSRDWLIFFQIFLYKPV
jgi:hypothetical protein